jgi:hypothetical protein
MANEHIDGPTTFDIKENELREPGKSMTVDPKFGIGKLRIKKDKDGKLWLDVSGR